MCIRDRLTTLLKREFLSEKPTVLSVSLFLCALRKILHLITFHLKNTRPVSYTHLLGMQGIIPESESEQIVEGLNGILADIESGKLEKMCIRDSSSMMHKNYVSYNSQSKSCSARFTRPCLIRCV